MLATQYGDLEEVVKHCKSKRLSESQYCLCKHHLNHNTLRISFFCSLAPLVYLSQEFTYHERLPQPDHSGNWAAHEKHFSDNAIPLLSK